MFAFNRRTISSELVEVNVDFNMFSKVNQMVRVPLFVSCLCVTLMSSFENTDNGVCIII